ncbi:MAG: hypothetical protein GX589_04795, partial [Deltaproteobacteria bacterium]|nr:hypothetical protein [Deltaproteobacteria bacterium]
MNLTPGKQQIRATPDLTLDSLSLPKNLFPESLVVRGPSEPDGRIKVIWKSPQRDPSTGEGPVITFYIEPGATDFDDINWKEGIKQKLLEIGADTLEADTAKGNPPFACKFFQEIAANYRFKSIENCSLSGSEVPLLRVWLGRIHNLTIKDAVVELQAQACTVEGLTCENSHLRIFCESSSSIQGLKVDESSYLSG